MPHSRIVVLGASAGGFEAVSILLRRLPEDLPAAVLVVIHTGPGGILASALARRSALPVETAHDGQPLRDGRVYIAPADRHLTVVDGVVRVAKGPREHGFRPAIDPLFISAARAGGERVAGVILSGALSDGTIGLHAIKLGGGRTIVQHPEEAAVPAMPLSALRSVAVDAVLPVAEIGGELTEWALNGARRRERTPVELRARPSERRNEQAPADDRPQVEEAVADEGGPAGPQLMAFTCPSCGGAINEVQEQGITHFECHVGHRFNGESLIVMGDERTENTLWKAARALQERALIRRRMIARAEARGLEALASAWHAEAVDAEMRAQEIRKLIEAMPTTANAQLVESAATARAGYGRRGSRAEKVASGGRDGRRPRAPTHEQARESRRLHQASRRSAGTKTRSGASNARPRKFSTRRKPSTRRS